MIKERVLNSGIRLVTEKIEGFNSAAMGIWVRTGAVNERPEIAGMSHLIEHMMFKGTESRSAKAIAEDVDAIGAQINAFTGKEATCYHIKSRKDTATKAFEIVADMFTNSVFDEVELGREKKVIFEEMKMIKDYPDSFAVEKIGELVFKNNPMGKSIIGTEDTVGSVERDHILRFIDEEYTKDSIVVSVAGGFDEERIVEIIDGSMGHLKEKKGAVDYRGAEYKPEFFVNERQVEQSHICLGRRSQPMEHDDHTAIILFDSIIGGSMSSRFFQKIREEKGLAYSVYSTNSSYTHDGCFTIYAAVAHENVEETIQAIKDEIKVIRDRGISKEELSMAKEQLKSAYVFGQESVKNKMYGLGKNLTLLGRIKREEEIMEKIDLVNMEHMNKVIESMTDIESYSGVVVGDRDVDLQKLIV